MTPLHANVFPTEQPNTLQAAPPPIATVAAPGAGSGTEGHEEALFEAQTTGPSSRPSITVAAAQKHLWTPANSRTPPRTVKALQNVRSVLGERRSFAVHGRACVPV